MNPDSRLLTTRRSLHGVAELVLAGAAEPRMWEIASTTVHEAEPTPAVRARYAEARDRVLDRRSPQ